jgi:PPM family protein phosphatase
VLAVPELDIGQATDVGRVRESNEDALLALELPPAALVAVADGLGGHAAGEVASALAVQTLREAFERAAGEASSASPGEPAGSPGEALRRAFERANGAVWEAALADPARAGMGTTLVAALVRADGRVTIANVGDSRAYLLAGGRARLLTRDHTWVAEQVAAGALSEGEARRHPYRNVLVRCIGADAAVRVDVSEDVRLEPGVALVLVSDGVTAYLEGPDLARELGAAATAQEVAERLVGQAVRRGGADNATAVVVWRRGADGPSA